MHQCTTTRVCKFCSLHNNTQSICKCDSQQHQQTHMHAVPVSTMVLITNWVPINCELIGFTQQTLSPTRSPKPQHQAWDNYRSPTSKPIITQFLAISVLVNLDKIIGFLLIQNGSLCLRCQQIKQSWSFCNTSKHRINYAIMSCIFFRKKRIKRRESNKDSIV